LRRLCQKQAEILCFSAFVCVLYQPFNLQSGKSAEQYQKCLLALHWQQGEKEPWLLATNFDTPRATLKAYRHRMWIDEMFGDFKKHGFDLEATRLRRFLPLSRLSLAVALLYVWLVSFGSQAIKNGKRRWVDRSDRRDLSIFRIGFDLLERCLVNDEPILIRCIPYFPKLSGS